MDPALARGATAEAEVLHRIGDVRRARGRCPSRRGPGRGADRQGRRTACPHGPPRHPAARRRGRSGRAADPMLKTVCVAARTARSRCTMPRPCAALRGTPRTGGSAVTPSLLPSSPAYHATHGPQPARAGRGRVGWRLALEPGGEDQRRKRLGAGLPLGGDGLERATYRLGQRASTSSTVSVDSGLPALCLYPCASCSLGRSFSVRALPWPAGRVGGISSAQRRHRRRPAGLAARPSAATAPAVGDEQVAAGRPLLRSASAADAARGTGFATPAA